MLSESDLMLTQNAVNAMSFPVTLALYRTGNGDAFEANMANIAAQVSGVSMGQVRMDESQEPIIPGKASLTLSTGLQRNIHYLAAPEGHEFASLNRFVMGLCGSEALTNP